MTEYDRELEPVTRAILNESKGHFTAMPNSLAEDIQYLLLYRPAITLIELFLKFPKIKSKNINSFTLLTKP